EELRSRANAPGPGMDLDAQPVRFGFYLLEMFFLEALVCIEIGDQDRVQLERRGIIEQGRRFPVHCADREVIETELELFLSRRRLCRRSDACQSQAGARHRCHLQESSPIYCLEACFHAEVVLVSIDR